MSSKAAIAPRMLTWKEAAAYCGLPISRFRILCSARPVHFTATIERWDIRDLDAWLDGLKSAPADDVDTLLARLG
jgi:hypothetical protein